MSVAIRAITRLQDADDLNVTLGAGVDEYALSWDNDTAKFVLRAVSAGVTDHGALTGLTPDDDHTQYALLAGRAGGQTLYGGTAANEDITIHGTSNVTRTTSYVLLQPTAGNVGIGTTAPAEQLDIGTGRIIGGTYRSTRKKAILDLSALNDAGGGGAYFIYDAGGSFRALEYSLRGTNDIFFQAAPFTSSGYGIFEAYLSAGAIVSTGGNTAPVLFAINRVEKMRLNATGLGIGTSAPATLLHVTSTTATNNALRNVLTLGANVTTGGVGAAGLGSAILFQAQSTTVFDMTQAAIDASWIVATHASRTSRLALKAYDTAEREGIRIDASGTAAMLGFFGHAAAVQPSAYATSNVSADRAFDADTVAVAELADVVGTLIADLQTLGLIA